MMSVSPTSAPASLTGGINKNAPMPDSTTQDEMTEWKKQFDHKKIGPISPTKNVKKALSKSIVVSKSSKIEYIVGDEIDVKDPFAGPVTELLTPTPLSLSDALATPQPESRHERSMSAAPAFDLNNLDTRLSFFAEEGESLSPTSVTAKSLSPGTGKSTGKQHKKSSSLVSAPANTVSRSKSTPKLVTNLKGKNYKELTDEPKDEPPEDNTMGLKLVAPGALDVMTGKAPLPMAQGPRTAPNASRTRAATFDFNIKKATDGMKDDIFVTNRSGDANDESASFFFGIGSSSIEDGTKTPFDDIVVSNTTTSAVPRGTSFTNTSIGKSFVIRSSELDPYQHQVNVPVASQLLMHAKLCQMMEGYSQLNTTDSFDFNKSFTGKSHNELEALSKELASKQKEQEKKKEEDEKAKKREKKAKKKTSSSIGRGAAAVANASPSQPNLSILNALLNTCDDLVVEGRLAFPGTGTEATIFSSQKERHFCAVFRGATDQQEKPISLKTEKKHDLVALDNEDHKDVMIHESLHKSYFRLEEKLFILLNTLSERDPFCDVVFCGHSYGGALACLGSVRLASLYPSMTVSCHSFGAPKVGDKSFRLLANSLPNLKVMRVEYGLDPYVKLPESCFSGGTGGGTNTNTWTHVGHTILITPEETTLGGDKLSKTNSKRLSVSSTSSTTISPSTTSNAAKKSSTPALKVLAYKFEDRKPTKVKSSAVVVPPSQKKVKKMKKDHELSSYIGGLEPFAKGERPWIQHFVGQEGKGIISGLDKEERLVC